MRFRQVHLDFHTSEAIAKVGAKFSPQQFQESLIAGHVDSVTVFSKCHHGWAYHPSQANETHPGLRFDLLGAQIAAAHEIGVKTPVYLSAGLDEKEAVRHPDWLLRDANDRMSWTDSFLKPGYHQLCLNSPYLDVLIAQIEETVRGYDVDGVFLDIVGVRTCYCHNCLRTLKSEGGDPGDVANVVALGERTYAHYARRVREAIDAIKPGLPVFHNNGHIRHGRRDLAAMNTHLELESLPTGGWGYDHFPMSARYAQTLGMDYLGMTGKFHTFWGEFGGYKHPNALRYETALAMANGARSSIGDQLAPDGLMDAATYALIGAAYAEVETKESWCVQTQNIADVALLSFESQNASFEAEQTTHTGKIDAGAVRILLEGKILFDVIDLEEDFSRYKVILLPDAVRITPHLQAKFAPFFAQGGKVLATGTSGLNEAGDAFALDLGARWLGANPYRPDYFRPHFPVDSFGDAAFIFYGAGQRIALDGGAELGHREDPYFNRTAAHFCSHQHTPSSGVNGGPGMTEGAHGIYFSWAVFEDYATKGSLILKETVLYAIHRLLGDRKTLETNLPAQGIVTLTHQPDESRYVHHLLYASPVKRGEGVEVIEDIPPLYDVHVTLRLPKTIHSATLEPQGEPLPFEQSESGVRFCVPKVECHQIVALHY